MKRKIELTEGEAKIIRIALYRNAEWEFAGEFIYRFLTADPANDGPEVAILRVDPQ
jgi:hypothetical protein